MIGHIKNKVEKIINIVILISLSSKFIFCMNNISEHNNNKINKKNYTDNLKKILTNKEILKKLIDNNYNESKINGFVKHTQDKDLIIPDMNNFYSYLINRLVYKIEKIINEKQDNNVKTTIKKVKEINKNFKRKYFLKASRDILEKIKDVLNNSKDLDEYKKYETVFQLILNVMYKFNKLGNYANKSTQIEEYINSKGLKLNNSLNKSKEEEEYINLENLNLKLNFEIKDNLKLDLYDNKKIEINKNPSIENVLQIFYYVSPILSYYTYSIDDNCDNIIQLIVDEFIKYNDFKDQNNEGAYGNILTSEKFKNIIIKKFKQSSQDEKFNQKIIDSKNNETKFFFNTKKIDMTNTCKYIFNLDYFFSILGKYDFVELNECYKIIQEKHPNDYFSEDESKLFILIFINLFNILNDNYNKFSVNGIKKKWFVDRHPKNFGILLDKETFKVVNIDRDSSSFSKNHYYYPIKNIHDYLICNFHRIFLNYLENYNSIKYYNINSKNLYSNIYNINLMFYGTELLYSNSNYYDVNLLFSLYNKNINKILPFQCSDFIKQTQEYIENYSSKNNSEKINIFRDKFKNYIKNFYYNITKLLSFLNMSGNNDYFDKPISLFNFIFKQNFNFYNEKIKNIDDINKIFNIDQFNVIKSNEKYNLINIFKNLICTSLFKYENMKKRLEKVEFIDKYLDILKFESDYRNFILKYLENFNKVIFKKEKYFIPYNILMNIYENNKNNQNDEKKDYFTKEIFETTFKGIIKKYWETLKEYKDNYKINNIENEYFLIPNNNIKEINEKIFTGYINTINDITEEIEYIKEICIEYFYFQIKLKLKNLYDEYTYLNDTNKNVILNNINNTIIKNIYFLSNNLKSRKLLYYLNIPDLIINFNNILNENIFSNNQQENQLDNEQNIEQNIIQNNEQNNEQNIIQNNEQNNEQNIEQNNKLDNKLDIGLENKQGDSWNNGDIYDGCKESSEESSEENSK